MPALLTPAGEAAVADLAQRYRVSEGAVRNLLDAVIRGGGAMAQFSHPDLGGSGQWMRGGMTMVGDMFNSGLQSTVSGICSELSSLMASGAVLVTVPDRAAGIGAFGSFSGDWWPAELGRPSSSGGQNDAAYAYFPGPRRLAIRRGGAITLYDTGDHAISGVQQQQGGRGSLEFSSQFGSFTVGSLPVVDGGSAPAGASTSTLSSPPAAPAAPPRAGADQPVVAPSVATPSPAGRPFGQSQSQFQGVYPDPATASAPPVAPSVPKPPQSAPIAHPAPNANPSPPTHPAAVATSAPAANPTPTVTGTPAPETSAPAANPTPTVTGTPAPETSAPAATPTPTVTGTPAPETSAPTAAPTPPATASSPVSPAALAPGTPAPAPATGSPTGGATTPAEIGAAIETLAGLRDKGFLTDEEFTAKKTELLARL